jgi:hypothetical protein
VRLHRLVPLVPLMLCAIAACAPVASVPSKQSFAHLSLPSTDGSTHTLHELLARHRWTVFLFHSNTCPTVQVHARRVDALAKKHARNAIGFYWIDSEVDASVERSHETARERSYHIPILIDAGARVADVLGARFASHAFILNDNGEVVYSGGIDSDKRFLHSDATHYLANALDGVLRGQTLSQGDQRTLGCALAR